MPDNYFLDNVDLQFHLKHIDLERVVALKEKGYTYHGKYAAAPRNYNDARDNYRVLLEVLGEICATIVAPRAAEADEVWCAIPGWPGHAGRADAGVAACPQTSRAHGAMLPWNMGASTCRNPSTI